MIHSVACCLALAVDTLMNWLMLDDFYFGLRVHPRPQSSHQKQVPFAPRWFCRREIQTLSDGNPSVPATDREQERELAWLCCHSISGLATQYSTPVTQGLRTANCMEVIE